MNYDDGHAGGYPHTCDDPEPFDEAIGDLEMLAYQIMDEAAKLMASSMTIEELFDWNRRFSILETMVYIDIESTFTIDPWPADEAAEMLQQWRGATP